MSVVCQGSMLWAALFLMQAMSAQAQVHIKGAFGPVLDWPLIPIHAAVLPDGRILSYGTDGRGQQGAQLIYDVWQPGPDGQPGEHLTLPNTTTTDIFCSAQVLLPGSGTLLLAGGDGTVNGRRNQSVSDVNRFDYRSNTLYASQPSMAFLRWYPTAVMTSAGEVLVLGGRADPSTPVTKAEVFHEQTGWRTLDGVADAAAFRGRNWLYPKAWQAPGGQVFVAMATGDTYSLDPTGSGALTRLGLKLPAGHPYLSSVMFAPGRILSLREFNQAVVIDLTGGQPQAQRVPGPGMDRYHASATVLPDGRVFLNGGSLVDNTILGASYTAKLWDPASATWTVAARAARMRLYHSSALLLPDGRVLTGGGGAPGPVRNLNVEIYTPPYLFDADGSGRLAVRPTIVSAPTTATWGQRITLATDTPDIGRVTLIRAGSATHSSDVEQRFMAPDFVPLSGGGPGVEVVMPTSAEEAPPGFYMVFAFNRAGVPSVARIIRLMP